MDTRTSYFDKLKRRDYKSITSEERKYARGELIGAATAKYSGARRYSKEAIDTVAKKATGLGRYIVMGEGKNWRLVPVRRMKK